MKKTFFLALFLLTSSPALAQTEAPDIDSLFDDAINEAAQQQIEEEKNKEDNRIDPAVEAQTQAGKLLEQKPNMIDLRDSQKRMIQEGEMRRTQYLKSIQENNEPELEEATDEAEVAEKDNEQSEEQIKEQKIQEITENHASAPFGLYWGISKDETKDLGFDLKSAERKDYQEVYLVTNPKQNTKTFDIVTAIFGEQDKLWCIFAQSTPQKDTPQATDVLNLYHQYYAALEKKYGNAKQFFSPNTYVEEIEEGDGEDSESKAEKDPIVKTNPIGNDNFLQELKEGSAVLYATFENDVIGITLGVSVDGNNQSYISIDYKNLDIMREEEQNKLNNLISDI
jgi:hypothetical protein